MTGRSVSNRPPPPRVLLVAEHDVHASMLRACSLNSHPFELIDERATCATAAAKVLDRAPDVVLLEWPAGRHQCRQALADIMHFTPTPVIALTPPTAREDTACFDALSAGAAACLGNDVLGSEEQRRTAVPELIAAAARLEAGRIIDPQRLERAACNPAQEAPACAIVFCEECGARNTFQPEDLQRPGMRYCTNCADPLRHEREAKYQRAASVTVLVAGKGGVRNLLHIVPHLPEKLCGAVLALIDEEPATVDTFCGYLEKFNPLPVRRLHHGAALAGGCCSMAAISEGLVLKQFSARHTMESHQGLRTGTPVDSTISSVATVFRQYCGVLVLSGDSAEAAAGARAVKDAGGTTALLYAANCLYRQTGEHVLQRCFVDKIVDEASAAQYLTQLHQNYSGRIVTA